MIDELGDRAEVVMARARREAMQREDPLVLPAHILVGLLEEGSPDGAGILAMTGLTADGVRSAASSSFSIPGVHQGTLATTSDAVDGMLDIAGHFAELTQRETIEPGHLLLALIDTVPFTELIGRSTLFRDLGIEEEPLRGAAFRWYDERQTAQQRSIEEAVAICMNHAEAESSDIQIPILQSVVIHRALVALGDCEGALVLRGTLVAMGRNREESSEDWRWLVEEAVEDARDRCRPRGRKRK